MKTITQLNKIFRIITNEVQNNPEFAKRIESAIMSVASVEPPKKKNRRSPPIFDPFEVFQSKGEESLRNKLNQLKNEQLKDIIAEFGMDQSKLAMKWRKQERLTNHIVMMVVERSSKGDAFR